MVGFSCSRQVNAMCLGFVNPLTGGSCASRMAPDRVLGASGDWPRREWVLGERVFMKRLCIGVAVLLLAGQLAWAGSLGAPAFVLNAVQSQGADTGAEESEISEGASRPGQQRLWIRSLDSQRSQRALLHVRFPGEVAADEPIVFECEVHSDSEIGRSTVRLEVIDLLGDVLHRGELELSVLEGVVPCRFTWDAGGLDDGSYVLRFEFERTGGHWLAEETLALTMLSEVNTRTGYARAVESVESLRNHLAGLDGDGQKLAYAAMRLAVAEDFLNEEQALGDDWLRIHRISEYASRTVDSIRARMTFAELAPEFGEAVPSPDLAALEIRNGAFYAEGHPVFLVGIRGEGLGAEDLERLRRYGMNLAVFEGAPGGERPEPADLDAFFRSARENNVSVAYVFHAPGGESLERESYTPAEAREEVEEPLRTLAAYLSRQEMANSLSIAMAPGFRFRGEHIREDFIERLKTIYEDRVELNRAWRTRLRSFEHVEIRRDFNRSSYQYDWQTYHRGLVTAHFTQLVRMLRDEAPGLPLQISFAGDIFEPRESRRGLDHEALSRLFPISGIGAGASGSDYSPVYALAYPGESMLVALWRSIAPNKPVFNLEAPAFSSGEPGRNTFHYMQSLVWDGAIEGLSAFAVPGWSGGAGGGDGMLNNPDTVEGLATATLDLNRLGEIVVAFQQAPATLAVLWSDSGKIYSDGTPYLASAARAYEGCSFAGHKLRFITEDQCANGGLAGVHVLIVPNSPALSDDAFRSLQGFIDGGGAIIRSATPIPYNEWGHSRSDVINFGLNKILIRGEDTSTEYLHAMDAAFTMGKVESIPRTINEYGYPLEGVKTRFVEVDGQAYLYLLNVRRSAVRCFLTGDFTGGRELIRGSDVEFPMVVEPLHPMLVRLDPPARDAAPDLDALEPDEDGLVPTAEVGPLPAASL